jgi:hypothetical protein
MVGPLDRSGEKSTALNSPPDPNLILESQLRECFGRLVYSTKTHEKCADECTVKLGHIKFAQIALSAVTTGGLVTAVLTGDAVAHIATVVSTILSTILLALNAYTKDSDPGQRAELHKKTASQLWDVRESYLSLISDLKSEVISLDDARKKRDELQVRLVAIYETAPRTSGTAYIEASSGLKRREELTFSDSEIDAFLPPALRRVADKQLIN